MSGLRWSGPALPVEGVVPALIDGLAAHGSAVLVAPPGSGKTTRVPAALLLAGLAGDGQVVVLQPRRLAARRAGHTLARWLGARPGDAVGWRVRFENRSSPATRLVVMTEGMLTRQLQSDPFLDGVNIVILDEFHERGVHADLALAVLRRLQAELRPELKILVMSATLDPEPVAAFLGGAPVLRAEGRCFPVTVRHRSQRPARRIEEEVADGVVELLGETEGGHLLAFLPGVGEIERTRALLAARLDLPVVPLHGRLPLAAQDAALQPTAPRTVVLATNIAETSVTLPGVRAVVDAGLERVPEHDFALGIDSLRTLPTSVASADQRAGRAGRTGPGLALRLWTPAAHLLRPASQAPELERVDLTELVLFLADLGEAPEGLDWLDAPPASSLGRARQLLRELGALDADGEITALGRGLASLPVHPRLGRVVMAGAAAGVLDRATTAAALMAERDPWGAPGVAAPAALAQRMAAVDDPRQARGGDRRALARVRQVRDQLRRLAGRLDTLPPAPRGGLLGALVAGFPERVGLRTDTGEARLATGGRARFQQPPPLGSARCFLAVALHSGPRGIRIGAAAPLDDAQLAPDWSVAVRWDPEAQRVRLSRERRWGALVFERRPARAEDRGPAAPEVARVLAEEARRAGAAVVLRPGPAVRGLQGRLALLARLRPDHPLPDVSCDALLDDVLGACRSFSDLAGADLVGAIQRRLDHATRALLARALPVRIAVPSGSEIALDYGDGSGPPVLAARIQQLFGLRETPRVLGEPVVVHLLAPNQRPAQVTRDLAGFWTGSYQEVRKQLRGRYPKHSWPEDPLTAVAENRPRRRR